MNDEIQDLEKLVSDLQIRRQEIDNKILSAYKSNLSRDIISQLEMLKSQVNMDLTTYSGMLEHRREEKNENNDTDGLII